MSKNRSLIVTLLVALLLPVGLVAAQEEETAPDEILQQIQEEIEDEGILYDDTTEDGTYEYNWDDSFADEDQSYFSDVADEKSTLAGLLGAGVMTLFAGVYLIVVLVFGLGGYIFSSLALMKIGKEMNYENAWFAWIPILSNIMVFQLGGQNTWLLLLLLIPGIGALIVGIISIIALMNITEKRGYEKLLGLLVFVPFGAFVLLYLLAWKPKNASQTPVVEKSPETPTM